MTTDEMPVATRRPPGSDDWFWFLGGQVRVLERGPDTGDSMSVLQFNDRRGQAPPLHVHGHEDELWIVATTHPTDELNGQSSRWAAPTRLG